MRSFRLAALLIAALVAPTGVLAAPARRPNQPGNTGALQRATTLLNLGKLDEAVQAFQDLVSQYPSSLEAQLGLGYALEKRGDTALAVEAYERAMRIDAKDVRVLNNLGALLVERNLDLSRGIRLVQTAVRLRPDFSVAWDNLGWAEYRRKNVGRAAEYLKKALILDPANHSAHFHLGMLYLRRNDYNLALVEFRKVVQADPGHIRAWISLGLTNQKLDRKKEAYQAYNRALRVLGPSSPLAKEVQRSIHELGPLYASGLLDSKSGSLMAEHDPDSVVPNSTSTGRVSPLDMRALDDRVGMSQMGSAPVPGPGSRREERREEDRGGGGDPLDRVLARGASPEVDDAPASPEVSESRLREELVERHLKLAELYRDNELPGDAVSEAQTVINLAPWSGSATRAKKIVEDLSGKEEPTPGRRIATLDRLATKLADGGDTAGSIAQYEKILLIDPRQAAAYKNLAYLNVLEGKNEVGLDQAKRALELEPEFPEALVIKGYIEAEERRFKESYDTYRRLTEVTKEGTDVHTYSKAMQDKIKKFVELQ